MSAQSLPFLSFNRGLISPLGLARIDIPRGRLSAEVMTNCIPRVLGSMMLRPGFGYIGTIPGQERLLPFVFANDDTAIIELTNLTARIWVDDALLVRPAVTATITNGGFNTNLTGWTDASGGTGTTAFVAGGYMGLTGGSTEADFGLRFQNITLVESGVEHALEITVARGPVRVFVGILPTAENSDEYLNVVDLPTGFHSLAFTPTTDFRIYVASVSGRQALVDSIALAPVGTIELDTPWATASLDDIRFDQSGDVIFVAADGYTQRRIVRRTARSWSVEQYLPEDGPFRIENVSTATITPSALTGNITLTASRINVFRSTHAPTSTNAGALFKVSSVGQTVSRTGINAQNNFTDAIRVTGVTTGRTFSLVIAPTVAGTAVFTLQRSVDSSTGPWTDVTTFGSTAQTTTFTDGLDNQEVWYRLGIKTGGYTSGTYDFSLIYAGGSIVGIARVTSFSSSTIVNAEVLVPFGGTTASDVWAEGAWSDFRGWPSAVAFHEGRLGWSGKSTLWLSVSDAFDVFDDATEGDSGPISRSIGTGPVDVINWMLSLERLVLGGDGAEWSVRSSSLDEPITPTNFSIKAASTQGSFPVQGLKVDRRGVFVQKSGSRVYELSFQADPNGTDYGSVNLTQLIPEVGEPSIVKIAVQRQPDTRIHCVRSDGTVGLLVIDPAENALCWLEVDTDASSGFAADIKDVVILPGAEEDRVYYVVQRTVNDVTVLYLEKWALESECQGEAVNKQSDAHVTYTGVATTVITGLTHLEDRQVSVWANGEDVGTDESTGSTWTHLYTVAGGQITLPVAATNVTVGLPYKAQWKSAKLALSAGLGTPLTKKKRVHGLGTILRNTHAQGLFFGRSFTRLDPLPLRRRGANVDETSVISETEDQSHVFPGEWNTDSRICLEMRSPRPCTLLCMVADADINEQR